MLRILYILLFLKTLAVVQEKSVTSPLTVVLKLVAVEYNIVQLYLYGLINVLIIELFGLSYIYWSLLLLYSSKIVVY